MAEGETGKEPAAAEAAIPSAAPIVETQTVRLVLRWLPFAMAGHLLIGLPTLIISLVVAYGTFVQARATQRMQQAAAWPFVAYDTSNYSDDGNHRINLTLTNNGVGPAMLGPVELQYQGKAMRTPYQLLEACCGYRPGQAMMLATTPASKVVLRPGEQIAFFDLRDMPDNAPLIRRMESERWKIRVRACYCSIFDDCWTIEGQQAKPQAVPQCPTNWQAYRER
ncbi:hypothetical protein KFK14_02465 [Sphingobium phenoxybenzoativorans]|uniref:Uncharacterized protein n=1 Tax=Sphingobium phenoxybenzoativorans TaxID=1592790 RepID=A0A975K8K8_9SPHN|nr:hypothetical protein [Sphingobium phenoxybenzoativorans]QUT06364.1 hypothetical protein KFK14_02465 [Sphingobium phenoxybenzoativorans]